MSTALLDLKVIHVYVQYPKVGIEKGCAVYTYCPYTLTPLRSETPIVIQKVLVEVPRHNLTTIISNEISTFRDVNMFK